ncbi:MAG: beta-ketothiolase BktB [Alphaproteobacteria bacterium]|nr:beta-ketothiolase BktB [Alphaproteobacteria bacterium]MBL6776496.1 beta-ketothiolase BktB [Alphaproteobacteria bacterium]
MTSVYILSAARTAIGSFGGSLKDCAPIDLGIIAAKEAIARAGMPADQIGHGVFGNVIHTEPRDMYISRCITIGAGMQDSAPALTVNRLCGSGLQAVVSATQLIQLGDTQTAIAGGTEVMSRGGYLVPAMRWGARLGHAEMTDMMLGALHDPFGLGHMGITAENVATDYDITREVMDEFALASQQRAAAAIKKGYFADQIVPVEVKTRREVKSFTTDEHPRGDTSLETLSGLRAAFAKDGAVTAGNSSGINDGAAALILSDEASATSGDRAPLAKIIAYGFGGVPARIMGMGPVPASQMALNRAGLRVSDIDVVESNEAFAAQACAVTKELGFASDIVNPNGGAIALGHPVGATGAIILTKLIYELHRRDARYGLATMCIGGGQGIAVIVDTKI